MSHEGQRGTRPPEESCYYTPKRVRQWLGLYPQLAEAVKYGCALDASDVDTRGSQSRTNVYSGLDGGFKASLLCIKCDLDMALTQLPRRDQAILRARFHGGLTVSELAQIHGISHQRISSISTGGVARMARLLGFT